jgi:putative DNA primase/helicase
MPVTDADVTAALLITSEEWAAHLASITEDDVATLMVPTDVAMAKFFVEWFGPHFRFSPQDVGDGWRYWSGSIWASDFAAGRHVAFGVLTVEILLAAADVLPIPEGVVDAAHAGKPTRPREEIVAAVRAGLRARLRQYLNSRKLYAMLDLAAATPPIRVDIAAYDADPWRLTCANGTLDLKTGTLRSFAGTDLCTKRIDAPYDPEARCPRFLNFLHEIFNEDDALVEYACRFLGYALTGVVREHVLPIWWGSGSNGKSTLLNLIHDLLGPFAQVAPVSLLLEAKRGASIPNDVARLNGVRFVAARETGATARLNEETIKAMTGGDKLTGRFLHREFFDFLPSHKVVLVTNHRPYVRGQDHGLWRRLALVPFHRRFWKTEDRPPKDAKLEDQDLGAKLRAELPGILALAVRACLVWHAAGLTRPAAVTDATAEYRDEQNPLGQFLEKHCDVSDPEGWTSSADLYAAYLTWAEAQHDRKPLSGTAFGRALGELGHPAKKHAATRGRQGITLGPGF